MGQRLKTIPTRVDLDRDLDSDFTAWADTEGRSKRRHAAILLQKLTKLQKDRPAELAALGLLDASLQMAGGRR